MASLDIHAALRGASLLCCRSVALCQLFGVALSLLNAEKGWRDLCLISIWCQGVGLTMWSLLDVELKSCNSMTLRTSA